MKIENIKNKDLEYMVERIEPYFASSIIIRGMLNKDNIKNILRINNGARWVYTNDKFFVIKKDIDLAQKEIDKNFLKFSSAYARKLINNCFKLGEDLINISKKIEKKSKRQMGREKSAELLEVYVSVASKYMIFQNMILFEKPISDLAHNIVKKYSKNKDGADRLLELITVSSRLTAMEKEQDDFLKLRLKKDYLKKAKNHAKQYGWLSLRFFVGKPWSEREVAHRLKACNEKEAEEKLKRRINSRINQELQISKAIKSFNSKDKKLVAMIRDIVFLRTQRTDFFQESSFYIQPLVKIIAKKLNTSYDDLLFLSASEVKESLLGVFNYKECIRRRKIGFLVFFDYENDIVLEDHKAQKYISERKILNQSYQDNKELNGKPGYAGKAKGRVKIIKSDKDNIKVKKGDIIVAIMTTPNFIPAMEKAAAFITDEGGVTCHAAIIAREMKKPCIIGTKIATKVLKDGDEVEVDAERGVVKILKKN